MEQRRTNTVSQEQWDALRLIETVWKTTCRYDPNISEEEPEQLGTPYELKTPLAPEQKQYPHPELIEPLLVRTRVDPCAQEWPTQTFREAQTIQHSSHPYHHFRAKMRVLSWSPLDIRRLTEFICKPCIENDGSYIR